MRLLVLWSRPQHLSREEAERWAQDELRRIVASDAVGGAALRRLEPASPRYGHEADWLLELDLAGAVPESVERGPLAEWLGDLRLLGISAVVVVAAGAVELGER